MKKFNKTYNKTICMTTLSIFLLALLVSGCNKFLNIPLPTNQTAAQGAFLTNGSTASVLSGVFISMVNSSYTAGSGSIGFETGLYVDETKNIAGNASGNEVFYTDILSSSTAEGTWTSFYQHIYACNVAIEGINKSGSILSNKNQYLGEAYATRAWLYFNLANIFGSVPLALSSDYKVNNVLARSSVADVYKQIISDAKIAESLLPAVYQDGSGLPTSSRIRPIKYAAEAILARAYLYTGDYTDAESAASDIIGNSNLFQLMPPSQTFTAAGNTELIWGLSPTGSNYVGDYDAYNRGMPAFIPAGGNSTITSYGAGSALSDNLINTFEANDARFTNWVRSTIDQNTNTTYYFPNKYKSTINGVEDVVLIRLAEIYLIRAEARAQLNNVSGAQADVNVIRTRAGLPNTTAKNQTDLLSAIAKERRVELFTEFGHRFYDLKRTNTIDTLMNVLSPQKGGTWSSYKQLWPISPDDIIDDPNLVQNPGYN